LCSRERSGGCSGFKKTLTGIKKGFEGRNADWDEFMKEALWALCWLLKFDSESRREANAAPGTAALVVGILRAHEMDVKVQTGWMHTRFTRTHGYVRPAELGRAAGAVEAAV
jgi:hypothetical protein